MNKTKIRPLSVALSAIMLFSCGYKKVEGDKHPDIPLFPDHTNPKIVFKKWFDSQFKSVYSDNKNFYFETIKDGRPQLIITDKKLQRKQTIKLSSDIFFISENSDVYTILRKDEDHKCSVVLMQKYIAPKYNNKDIQCRNFIAEDKYVLRDRIRKVFADVTCEEQVIDSIHFVDSVRRAEIVLQKQQAELEISDLFTDSLQSVSCEYSSYYLLTYPNSEKLIKVSEDYKCFLPEEINIVGRGAKLLSNYVKNDSVDSYNKIHDCEFINCFESAVMDNIGSGSNHFIPGCFTQEMLYYMDLKLFDQKVQFKTEHTKCVFILYRKPEEIALLLDNTVYLATYN